MRVCRRFVQGKKKMLSGRKGSNLKQNKKKYAARTSSSGPRPHPTSRPLSRTVATEWCLSSREGARLGTQSVGRSPGRLASVMTTLETRGHGESQA